MEINLEGLMIKIADGLLIHSRAFTQLALILGIILTRTCVNIKCL